MSIKKIFNPSLFLKRNDLQAAIAVISLVCIVIILLVPLSSFVLDLLIVINIAISLYLIVRTFFVKGFLFYKSFPQLLLFATFFRLALNIASTKLILLHGDKGMHVAGDVIRSFGQIVVQGNFIVGAIVFSIVTLVNYFVIAKGSARVAEVSARFNLDSLPGKQLAIDAELRTGMITKEQASAKRDSLSQESQFFGSMDGAMKFVQGDAIIGIVITCINVIGGIALGLERGISFEDAINTFGVLTIGDGLVNIFPALLISVCAGIVVTQVIDSANRNTAYIPNEESLKIIYVTALAMLLFAVLPGMPYVPFLLVAVALFVLIYYYKRKASHESIYIRNNENLDFKENIQGSNVAVLDYSESVIHGISETIIISVDSNDGMAYLSELEKDLILTRAITEYQKRYQGRFGIAAPHISFQKNIQLQSGEFSISIRENILHQEIINYNSTFLPLSDSMFYAFGLQKQSSSYEPNSGLSGGWVLQDAALISSLKHLGIKIRLPYQFVIEQAYSSYFNSIDNYFGLCETELWLKQTKEKYPVLVSTAISTDMLSIYELSQLLKWLLKEKISIADSKMILQGVIEYYSRGEVPEQKNILLDDLHSYLRLVLKNQLHISLRSVDGEIRILNLSNSIQKEFVSLSHEWDGERYFVPVDKELDERLQSKLDSLFTVMIERGFSPLSIQTSDQSRKVMQEYLHSKIKYSNLVRVISDEESKNIVNAIPLGIFEFGR